MAISLYDLSVASYLQTLTGVAGYLDRALGHFQDNGVDPDEIVETRLFGDMLPFRFQVLAVAHHSLGAIKGVQAGLFNPPGPSPAQGFIGLQQVIADARAGLEALTPDEVNALEGKDVVFAIGERRLPFVAENFLMSFSLPNFHFHATTAYDILRMKGAPLGKRDYMGPMRLKL
jgi:hypothetical protein